MFSLSDDTTCLLIGVALHVFVLRKGEWDLAVFKMLTAAAISPLVLATWQAMLHGMAFSSALWRSYRAVGISIFGIYLSLTIYRVGLHRLNRFPGPFLARVSSFYITGVVFKRHQEYLVLEELHKQYGDVVRIGG
jgi:cytochrome P450 family 628